MVQSLQECTLWFGVSAFASLYLTLLLIMSGPQETCTMRLLKVKESHVHAIPTHFVSRPAMRNFTRRISHRYTCKQGHTEACVLTPDEAGEVRALHHHPVPALTFTMPCLLPSRRSHWLRRFSTLSNNPKSTNLRRYVQDYSKIVIGKTNPTTKRFHTTTSVTPVQAHIHCYPLSPSTESE